MFTCSTLLLFLYPVPADIHGSVQHVILRGVPVDVLPKLFLCFSQVKDFECRSIRSPQEVQCVHMYMQCGLRCTSYLYQSLFDRNWSELWGGGAVWGGLFGGAVYGETVYRELERSCVGRAAHVVRLCGGAVWYELGGGELWEEVSVLVYVYF